MSISRVPGDVPTDGSTFPALIFSNEPAGAAPRPSTRQVIAICVSVVLLPCVAIGFFWAAIALVN